MKPDPAASSIDAIGQLGHELTQQLGWLRTVTLGLGSKSEEPTYRGVPGAGWPGCVPLIPAMNRNGPGERDRARHPKAAGGQFQRRHCRSCLDVHPDLLRDTVSVSPPSVRST